MSNTEELKDALREVLDSRGVLGDVKAKLRKEVFDALDDKGSDKPELCRENLLLNELIREYLSFNNYNYSCSVLLTESGQPQEPIERSLLVKELNLHPDTDDKVPLLYHILSLLSSKSIEPQHQRHCDSTQSDQLQKDIELESSPKRSSHTTACSLPSKCTIEKPTIFNST